MTSCGGYLGISVESATKINVVHPKIIYRNWPIPFQLRVLWMQNLNSRSEGFFGGEGGDDPPKKKKKKKSDYPPLSLLLGGSARSSGKAVQVEHIRLTLG